MSCPLHSKAKQLHENTSNLRIIYISKGVNQLLMSMKVDESTRVVFSPCYGPGISQLRVCRKQDISPHLSSPGRERTSHGPDEAGPFLPGFAPRARSGLVPCFWGGNRVGASSRREVYTFPPAGWRSVPACYEERRL